MKSTKIFLSIALAAALFLSMFQAVGCNEAGKASETGTRAGQDGQAMGDEESEQAGQEPQGGPIALTLYFMGETPSDFYLQAEKRTIPYTQAVARAAMEELFKGPAAGSSLKAIFPNTVKVLDVSISGGVCTVNVSKEILTDKAAQGGAGAEVEALALASIADTLTEFPSIQKVKLLIEGKQSGTVDGFFIEDFWGHVGLPEYLERDTSDVK
jgi:spore germination protein GerM